MVFRSPTTSLTARLLAVLVLLQCVLPTAIAGHSPSHTRWVEVCANGALTWAALPGDEADAPVPAAGDHCPLCASTGAAPEFDANRYLSLSFSRELAALPVATTAVRYAGHTIRSRAPPR